MFEFLENEKLYATPWAANALGAGKTPFKQNVFGFTFDGPVYLPKVIDGRNKLFFMISLEALRERNPGCRKRLCPRPEQLQGDFSGLRDNPGRPIAHLRSSDHASRAENGAYLRDPFPNNRIPANRINPIAAKSHRSIRSRTVRPSDPTADRTMCV